MDAESPPHFVPIGSNPARLFGLDATERARRLAVNAGFPASDEVPAKGPAIMANMHFAWDPAWLKLIGSKPGSALMEAGEPVLAHVPAGAPTRLRQSV